MIFLATIIMSVISIFSPIIAAQNNVAREEAKQVTETDNSAFATTINNDDKISLALFTKLELELCSNTDYTVTAVLTNDFTLFPSTVKVGLYLYSSLTKTTDISKMTLEGSVYSPDLNMNTDIRVTASTHNEDRYWVGYAIYYKNNTEQTYQTDPKFYYADGSYNPAF